MRNNVIASQRGFTPTCSGDPIHVIYEPSLAKDGSVTLVEAGKENTDEIIESYRESTELTSILARFRAGDESALNRYAPFYADLTEFPKDYRQILDSSIRAEGAFNALPMEVREYYGSDWHRWLSAAGSDDWIKVMSKFFPQDKSGFLKEEVVSDES